MGALPDMSVPVDWPRLMAADTVYTSVRATLPWVQRRAAGDLYKFIKGPFTPRPWVDSDHISNVWLVADETDDKIDQILGPHGPTLIRIYAIQRVEATWLWKGLDRILSIPSRIFK